MSDTPYSQKFYDQQRAGSSSSASQIVPWLHDIFKPKSVIDIGCGVGTWAAEFIKLKVPTVLGIDGEYAKNSNLVIPEDQFQAVDLADEARTSLGGKTFNMSICLEVAEHLPTSRAESFVQFVTSLAPVAVFGSAIPGQGGTNHVNEQWQSFWAKLFDKHGFYAVDIVRPQFWMARVSFWYVQNTIVYVKKGHDVQLPATTAGQMLDCVHPGLANKWRRHMSEQKPRR